MFPMNDTATPPQFPPELRARHERVGDAYLHECARRGLFPLVVAWCSPRGMSGPVEAYLFFNYEESPDGQFFTAPHESLLVALVVDAVEAIQTAGRN